MTTPRRTTKIILSTEEVDVLGDIVDTANDNQGWDKNPTLGHTQAELVGIYSRLQAFLSPPNSPRPDKVILSWRSTE